ncbi:uncharacterized protein J7T54_005881 [Emericellopsis cladophorae]|uniref:Uncharacterized protein n=1 Tax=Emericellopsis cladophorae TaxID=2686198 RepID=A0A9P9Y8L2_9HYPO|nr:uncharacterized protein J7T54_005881 [Emericellopsis cladophorae]KAI6785547.1 hypothetical protein J7T54_005881 [Emericellopsis cladophorae]
MLDISRPVPLGHIRGESVNVVTQVNGDEEARTKGEALRRETDKAEHRADGLKRSIVELNTFSSTATRRLDETYYAVLEKTSALQNTIMALKDLAEGSKEIYGTFETEASELESDIRRQLDGLGSFEGQENKIKSLQSRIGEGRRRMRDLSARVDAVRERVESWERADQAWQDKTRRRLKVAWKVVFIFILAAVTLLVGLSYVHPEEHAGTTLDELRDAMAPSLWQKAFNISRRVPIMLSNCEAGSDAELSDVLRRTAPTDRGDLLRDFDEL